MYLHTSYVYNVFRNIIYITDTENYHLLDVLHTLTPVSSHKETKETVLSSDHALLDVLQVLLFYKQCVLSFID
jgi:hypothetical protein